MQILFRCSGQGQGHRFVILALCEWYASIALVFFLVGLHRLCLQGVLCASLAQMR